MLNKIDKKKNNQRMKKEAEETDGSHIMRIRRTTGKKSFTREK